MGGAEDLGLNKVNLADPPFECYFTEMIPPITFDDFRDPRLCLHFASKFE